jgi:hypothetical protein
MAKRRAWGFGLVLALVCTAPALGDDNLPYRPIPARIGAPATPPPDLLEAVKTLREAADGRDIDAVAAMFADRPLMVSSGIAVGTSRSAKPLGPWADASSALADVGSYFQEGDIAASGRKVDFTELYVGNTLGLIANSLEEPNWGRDPLVADAICTYRGARWTVPSARSAPGADISRAFWVERPTPAKASAAPDAGTVATLKPGYLYLEGYLDGLPEEMRGLRLPKGGVGAVDLSAVRDATQWGICLKKVGNGWRIAAFSTALL